MHAYLLVGPVDNQGAIEGLAKKLAATILEFPVTKIEDARELNNLIRLSFDEPTLIVSKNIHEATEEALNAFLKNLEEPQDNIYFALTATSTRKVLPTIVSRCQIIMFSGEPTVTKSKEIEDFLRMSKGEKLAYIDRIKDRESACKLIENTVNLLHSKLHLDRVKYTNVAENIELAAQTLTRLKANGNVNLQLANFAVRYA